jgi:hypothetical protein
MARAHTLSYSMSMSAILRCRLMRKSLWKYLPGTWASKAAHTSSAGAHLLGCAASQAGGRRGQQACAPRAQPPDHPHQFTVRFSATATARMATARPNEPPAMEGAAGHRPREAAPRRAAASLPGRMPMAHVTGRMPKAHASCRNGGRRQGRCRQRGSRWPHVGRRRRQCGAAAAPGGRG